MAKKKLKTKKKGADRLPRGGEANYDSQASIYMRWRLVN